MSGGVCCCCGPHLAVGSVDLVDYVCQQDFLLHGAVQLLVLGVLVDLHVVTFERLTHTAQHKRSHHVKDILGDDSKGHGKPRCRIGVSGVHVKV